MKFYVVFDTNLKHFPRVEKVVLPAEMLAIILSRP